MKPIQWFTAYQGEDLRALTKVTLNSQGKWSGNLDPIIKEFTRFIQLVFYYILHEEIDNTKYFIKHERYEVYYPLPIEILSSTLTFYRRKVAEPRRKSYLYSRSNCWGKWSLSAGKPTAPCNEGTTRSCSAQCGPILPQRGAAAAAAEAAKDSQIDWTS